MQSIHNPCRSREFFSEILASGPGFDLIYAHENRHLILQAIIAKLQRAVANIVNSEELRGYMQNGGYVPDGRSSAEFRALVLSDYQRFRELARIANIREE